MADITTREQYERTRKVYESGVTERGTRADREKIGDLTVAMTCPKGHPREPQFSHAERLMRQKGFTIGHPERVVKKARRKTKKELKEEADVLLKETGATELPNIGEAPKK